MTARNAADDSLTDTHANASRPIRRRKTRFAIFTVLGTLILLSGCPGPTYDFARLRAVEAESQRLMATYVFDPANPWAELPRDQWPPAIASLQPKTVAVRRRQVLIAIVPFFDGGWGYEIVRKKEDLRMPVECYLELPEGVYWHDPC